MIARLRRTLKVLLVLTLMAAVYVGWARVTDRDLVWPMSAVIGDGKEVTGTDPDFRDLEIDGGSDSPFHGSVTVENPTGGYQEVIVTVDVFDGEQNVGELWGSVTLKPQSASSVELASVHRYAKWTDARVDLTRMSD